MNVLPHGQMVFNLLTASFKNFAAKVTSFIFEILSLIQKLFTKCLSVCLSQSHKQPTVQWTN